MPEVCVSRNMKITSGVLGIEKWSIPRHVGDSTFNSVGDGTLAANQTLPGKLMIDGTLSWTSDSPLPTNILLRVNRAYRDFVTSNPNVVQFRDRWTYKIGTGPQVAEVPDVSATYQSQFGGGVDLGTSNTAVPFLGKIARFQDAHITEDWIGPVPVGETINVRYRCYVWTPQPFSNNANNNSPVHEARARSTQIQLIAFPTQDTMAVTG